MEYGKLPPQAVDIEKVVLGALMLEADAYDMVAEFIKEDFFYKPHHQKVFQAISELKLKNEPCDMLAVTHKLKALNNLDIIGGPHFIAKLTGGVGSAANIEYHCRILQEKFIKRELIRIASEVTNQAFEDSTDVFDLVGFTQSELDKLITFHSNDYSPAVRMSLTRELIHKARSSDTGLSGVPTGYDTMDSFTGGWQPGDLIVKGGWPGTYKSALALALLDNAEKSGVPGLWFEGEMSEEQVGIREISKQTGIDIHEIKTGRLTNDDMVNIEGAIGRIEKKKLFVDFEPGLKAYQIISKIKKAIKEWGIGIVVIDHLRLYDIEIKKWGTEESAIDAFCRELKTAAKRLKIPIILICHFTKQKSESDNTKPPHMGLLKGSGGISANADIVMLLWNPAATDPNFVYDFRDGKGLVSCKGKIGIVYDKNRQGPLGLQWLNVSPGTHIFSDREVSLNTKYPNADF